MRVAKALTAVGFCLALSWGLLSFASTDVGYLYTFFLSLTLVAVAAFWFYPIRPLPSAKFVALAIIGLFLTVQLAIQPPLWKQGYVVLVAGWLGLILALHAIPSPGVRKYLYLFLIGLGLLEAFYGLAQSLGGWDFIGDYERGLGRTASGTYINRNHFAGLLNMTIPLALGALYATFPHKAKERKSEGYAWAWIVLLVCGFMGLAILLSLSRAGTLAMLGGLVFLGLLISVVQTREKGTRLPGRVTVILLVLITGLGLWVGMDALVNRFFQAGDEWARPIAYRDSIKFIAANPLGVGPGMYRWRFRPSPDLKQSCWWSHAHNDYLETAADWGILPALLFWSFAGWRLWTSSRTFLRSSDLWTQGMALGCGGAIFTLLLHSAVDFNLQIPANWVIFCVILGLTFLPRDIVERFAARPALRTDWKTRVLALFRDPAPVLRVVFSVLLLVGAWGVYKQTVGLHFAALKTVEGYKEALKWVPEDASYHFLLALQYRDSLDAQDLKAAGMHFEKAVELNPYNWFHWQELGRYHEFAGDPAKTEHAYLEVLKIVPYLAEFRWRIGNFYLRQGRARDALEQIKRAIELDPSYRQATLMLLWRAGLMEDDFEAVWPRDPQSELMLVRFLLQTNADPDRVRVRWERFLRVATHTENTGFYLDYLYKSRRFAELREQWIRINKMEKISEPDFEKGENLVWNGEFERDVSKGLLDWRLPGSPALHIEQVEGEGRDLSRGLRIDFDATENISFALTQRIIVPRAGRYTFSAAIRSKDITTDQGVYFEVAGRQTEQVRATTTWTEYRVPFEVESDSQVIEIHLKRNKSRKLDDKIGGVVWLDQVRVAPASDEQNLDFSE